jgi:hypothetical protein
VENHQKFGAAAANSSFPLAFLLKKTGFFTVLFLYFATLLKYKSSRARRGFCYFCPFCRELPPCSGAACGRSGMAALSLSRT